MLTIISPSKTLKYLAPSFAFRTTMPMFLNDADRIVDWMRLMSVEEISTQLKVSSSIARLTFERIQQWNLPFTDANSLPAIFYFRGDVFTGLDANALSEPEVYFSQNSVRILSALYGVLRPLDLMQPYRLDMGLKFKLGKFNNLYDYWGDRLLVDIEKELNNHEVTVLINLASQEYYKAVGSISNRFRVITPIFYDVAKGKPRIVAIHAKRARGLMTRFIIKNRIEEPDQLKLFQEEGYIYSPNASSGDAWAFVR